MVDVGERLSTLRRKQSLSQRELAKRANMPNSTVSAIEKNRVSPSVSSLKKLLDALSVSLSEFFAGSVDKKPQVFFRGDAMVDVGTGGVQRKIMGQTLVDQTILLMDETFPAGFSSGELISHEGEETGIIISGEIEVTVGDEVCLLSEGDGYQFDSQTPHRFRNLSNAECRLICCSSPASF